MLDKSIDIKIARKEFIQSLGGDRCQRISTSTKLKIEKMEAVIKKLATPSLHFEKQKIVRIKRGSLHAEKGVLFKSQKLANSLKDCSEMICFLATLGEGVDRKIKMLMEQNELSNAYIMDVMGSTFVEVMVSGFYLRMRDKFRMENRGVSLRFSPGYCDWPVEDQRKLFQLFNSKPEHVILTESCLMRPRKSISGVFGIKSPEAKFPSEPYNPCHSCQRPNCDARRSDRLANIQ